MKRNNVTNFGKWVQSRQGDPQTSQFSSIRLFEEELLYSNVSMQKLDIQMNRPG